MIKGISFGKFFSSAIRMADRRLANQGGIARKYDIRSVGVDMVCSTLSEGWDAFDELSSRMSTGYIPYSTGVGAVLGVASFVASPAMIVGSVLPQVGKSLSFWGGNEKAVSSMYDNKSLILAVHQIGQATHSEFERHQNDEDKLQNLKEKIVADLIKRAK